MQEIKQETINNKVGHMYTKEFRAQMVGVYKSGVYNSIKECAKAYGVLDRTLQYWVKKDKDLNNPAIIKDQTSELARLRKENATIKMENDILKKAAIYFANQAR